MTRVVRGVLEQPTVLRLAEPVPLPLHVPVEVTITEPTTGEAAAPSALLTLAETLHVDGPEDFAERWEAYLADDERARSQ